jgi:hypothetical protein
MIAANVSGFQSTVADSFSLALGDVGPVAREFILNSLAQKGIGLNDIFARFADIARILEQAMGSSFRLIISKTLKEINRRRLEQRLEILRLLDFS